MAANKTINEERRMLKAVWECLIKHGKIPEYDLATLSRNNPVAKTDPLPKKPVRKGSVIPQDDLVKFFNGAIEESKAEEIDFFVMFLTLYVDCGRKMEIQRMEPYQIDLNDDEVKYPDTKTGVEKRIPIHPFLRPYLAMAKERAMQNKWKYVFPDSDGKMMGRNKLRYRMIKICKKVGIPRSTPHDLRHTFASNPKLSRDTKIKIGGWKSKRTFDDVYNNPLDEPIRQEYIKWDIGFLPAPAADYLHIDTKKTQR